MRILLFPVLLIALLFASCSKDEEGTLEVVFKASYDEQPLVMFESYDYGFGQDILFSKIDMYISDLRLIAPGGNETMLSDIELIDLSFTERGEAEQGVKLTFRNVEARTYDNLSFGVGVEPGLNAMAPEEFDSSHPLSNAGNYWLPWTSYIFAKLEGRLDTLGNSQPEEGLGWLYHTGTDPLYVDIRTNGSVSVVDDATTRIELQLDYYKLLGMPGDPIDIQSKPINHNPLDTNEISTIIENYPSAFSFVVR